MKILNLILWFFIVPVFVFLIEKFTFIGNFDWSLYITLCCIAWTVSFLLIIPIQLSEIERLKK